jgi:hypothetical protein
LGPTLGERPGSLCGIPDLSSRKYSREPTARLVRFGDQGLELPESTGTRDEVDAPSRTTTHAPVASATLDASYRGHVFHVTAWQPQGKPAFVFMVVLQDRRWIQPDVAEAADFEEVLRNAVAFVERFLDGEVGEAQ